MPVYEFTCAACTSHFSLSRSIAEYSRAPTPRCPDCNVPLARTYDIPVIASSFQAHWNPSVGAYVKNMGEFNSALSRRSDEQAAATGDDTKYVAADPRDVASDLGVSTIGLESTMSRAYNDDIKRGVTPKKEQSTRWL